MKRTLVLCVLLVGAGLFVRSLINSQSVNPGFATESTALATFNTDVAFENDAEARDFFSRLLERLESHPGIAGAALSDRLPLTIGAQINGVFIEGVDPPPGEVSFSADFAFLPASAEE